jgi:serine/threonine protein phosphatase PrpC
MGNGLVNSGGWRIAGASVRGSSHEKLGLPCQDAHEWTIHPNGTIIAAVADGAGSAPLAEVGAKLACKEVVRLIGDRLNALSHPEAMKDEQWKELLTQSVTATRAAIELEAESRSARTADLATTLLVAAAREDFVAAMQIGDGAIIAAESEDTVHCVSRPSQSEYVNETSFLTSPTALAEGAPVIWRGQVVHLALLSDGLQMAALRMPEAEPHPGFFAPLFRFVRSQQNAVSASAELVDFLNSPRLRERTDDDVTLVLATLKD